MNNFIFENSTKVAFGKECVKEFLSSKVQEYGDNVMLAYGGNSIKKNGIYDEVVNILKENGKNITEFWALCQTPHIKALLKICRSHSETPKIIQREAI